MNTKIQEIASSSLVDLMKNIRCGFELEAQEIWGLTDEEDIETMFEAEFPHSTLQWGPDNSVGAGEIRTVGALTVPQFLSASRDLFCHGPLKDEIKIDEQCSFHIHISIPGIRHQYSSRFQQSLIEGVLKNSHKLPGAVLSRWQHGDWLDKYFPLALNRGKYAFVSFHRDLGTWEFRCFGNVQDFQSAVACLKVAAEAMRYAYRVRLGLEIPMFRYGSPDNWLDETLVALEESYDFEEFKRKLARCAYEHNIEFKPDQKKVS